MNKYMKFMDTMAEDYTNEIRIFSDIPARAEINGKIYNLGIGKHTLKI